MSAVTHPLLHPTDVCLPDHPGPEGVSQVVEAQLAQGGALDGAS